MPASILLQKIFHVFEKLYMTTLVTGNSNCLRIFFNCGFYYFFYTTVMTQMNNFCAFTLHNSAHNINGSIMTIKKTGGSNNTNFICRSITHIGKNTDKFNQKSNVLFNLTANLRIATG